MGAVGPVFLGSIYCESTMRNIWLMSAVLLLVAPAHADPARDALSAIAKCTDIASSAERLQCFDAAAPNAKNALVAPAPTPQAKPPAAAEEEEGGVLGWFGLSRPTTKPEDFGKPPAPVAGPKEIQEISAGVLELAKNAYGRAIFILDNGQIWKQIDGDTTEVRPAPRDETLKVTIEKGLMGSYALSIEGRRGIVKVRRVK
jgi:hypothetical protein